MTTVIHTQVIENYGLEDGKNYWKAKGGNVYFVEGTDQREWNAVAMVNKIIQEHFGADNAYCQEYISNVEVSDDPNSLIEEWDTPARISWESTLPVERLLTTKGNFKFGIKGRTNDRLSGEIYCSFSCCTDKEGNYHGKGILNSGHHDRGTWEDEPL